MLPQVRANADGAALDLAQGAGSVSRPVVLPNWALTPRPILAALTEWWMIPSLRSGPSQCLLPGVPQATSSTLQGAVLISVVTRVELEGGVYREPAQAPRRARFDAMLSAIPGLAFDDLAIEVAEESAVPSRVCVVTSRKS